MSFRITARTILQLGAELISSDGVAFYELIKNAFDAGSRRVDINVCVRMDHANYLAHHGAILEARTQSEAALTLLKEGILRDLHPAAPQVDEFSDKILSARSVEELSTALEEANFIEIKDSGHGMTTNDLEDIYLTIGTPHRQNQRKEQSRDRLEARVPLPSVRPILGEKGIGRLSVMRLGWRLWVETTTEGELHWNTLKVDWRDFTRDDALIQDVNVSPSLGQTKQDTSTAGTTIKIYALTSEWSLEKLTYDIAQGQFSKLTDPFVPEVRYPINLRYNSHRVRIPRFDRILFDYAHAAVDAQFTMENGEPKFTGHVDYKTADRETTFALDRADLLGICELRSADALRSLGSFSVHFYWYNRRILTAIEGIGDRRKVRELVNEWSGGLKVYRDGFRVNPYGNADDDWLDLDRRALASSGYKVNRRQIIGVVTIASFHNPALIDQTNREGLRENPEKLVLVKILKHLIEVQFRQFLNEVDRQAKALVPVTFDDLEERVDDEERRIRRNLERLLDKYPEVKKDQQIFNPINDALRQIRSLMNEASLLAESYKEGHSELTNLAGLGLMVEIVAHELNRATDHALRTIASADRHTFGGELDSVLDILSAQMETLQKRLRILDPLSTAGRQRKETFDLISWVQQILASHNAQFARHKVQINFKSNPPGASMRVHMVRGMCVQILENLISNSMYWLKSTKAWDSSFQPVIDITVDVAAATMTLADNGPGIPVARKDQVFQPFFTTKPPGEGHGLGLYVSREIASYNGASLTLSDQMTINSGRLNTFVLNLKGG